jgi:hypothetical protein
MLCVHFLTCDLTYMKKMNRHEYKEYKYELKCVLQFEVHIFSKCVVNALLQRYSYYLEARFLLNSSFINIPYTSLRSFGDLRTECLRMIKRIMICYI